MFMESCFFCLPDRRTTPEGKKPLPEPGQLYQSTPAEIWCVANRYSAHIFCYGRASRVASEYRKVLLFAIACLPTATPLQGVWSFPVETT